MKLDIQSMLTVIRRRKNSLKNKESSHLNLQTTCFQATHLMNAHLEEADLRNTHFEGADLRKTQYQMLKTSKDNIQSLLIFNYFLIVKNFMHKHFSFRNYFLYN